MLRVGTNEILQLNHTGQAQQSSDVTKLLIWLIPTCVGAAIVIIAIISLVVWFFCIRNKRRSQRLEYRRSQEKSEDNSVNTLVLAQPEAIDRKSNNKLEKAPLLTSSEKPPMFVDSQTQLNIVQEFFTKDKNSKVDVIEYKDIKIHEKIGHGGFATVYRATYKKEVAVKLLTCTDYDLIKGEIMLMSQINHPNVIKLLGVCFNENNIMLILEFAKKGNLKDFMLSPQGKQLLWRQKLAMLKDMARGLCYLHDHKIIHRDIKSENFLLEDDLTVKVCDFSISKLMRHTLTHTVPKGSFKYFAPEIINGNKIGPASDVFAFSFVMWEVFTGQELFKNLNPLQVPGEVVRGTRPPLPQNGSRSKVINGFSYQSAAPLHRTASSSSTSSNSSSLSSHSNNALSKKFPSLEATTLDNATKQQQDVFISLMCECWDAKPEIRPTFKEILRVLESI